MIVDARTGLDRRQRAEPWHGPERRIGERRQLALAGGPSRVGSGFPTGRLVAALADPWFRVLVMVFVGAQLLDLVTTYSALASGRFQEGNPLFGGAVNSHSGVVVLAKLVVAVGVVMITALEISSISRRRVALGAVAAVSVVGPGLNLLHLTGVL